MKNKQTDNQIKARDKGKRVLKFINVFSNGQTRTKLLGLKVNGMADTALTSREAEQAVNDLDAVLGVVTAFRDSL